MDIIVKKRSEIVPGIEITELESQLGSVLPEDYRDFLKTYNAIWIEPRFITAHDYLNGCQLCVMECFCLDPDTPHDLNWKIKLYEGSFPKGLLAFASDPGGSLFLISLRETDFGVVYFWSIHKWDGDDSGSNIIKLADSFRDFLSKLEPF
jgi:hypothetical protein